MSESSPGTSVQQSLHKTEERTRADQKQTRRVFPTRSALEVGLLYALGRLLAVVYPPFGAFAGEFFSGLNPLLTTGAILATAWFTKTLWQSTDEMRRGNEAALSHLKESSEQELRAYVFPRKVRTVPGTPLAALAAYAVQVKNSGKTPAFDLLILSGIAIGPRTGMKDIGDLADASGASRGPLAPGTTVMHFTESQEWTLAQQRRIDAGDVVYLHGVIRYHDAFGRNQWTRFRFVRADGSHELMLCEEGNDAKRDDD